MRKQDVQKREGSQNMKHEELQIQNVGLDTKTTNEDNGRLQGLVTVSHETNHGNMAVKQKRHSSDGKRSRYVLHGQQGQTEEEGMFKVEPLSKTLMQR